MLEKRIKLRHLSCFLEVAAQRSFIVAAEMLHLTQPAVSKAIAELEDILGTALFERSRRGVFLTSHGEAFRRYAGATLTALRQGIDTVAQGVARGGYILSVGVLPTVAACLMPDAVRDSKQAGLGATLRVIIGPNDFLLKGLRDGSLDLVVGRLAQPEAMRGLLFEHLYSEGVVFVVRPGHPLAGGAAVALRDLARFTVLLPVAGSIIRPAVDQLLIAHGVATLPDVIETVSPTFGRRYTRTSDAVWIISRGVVAEDVAEGHLTLLPVDADEASGPVGLTTKADVPLSVSAELLVQAIRRASTLLRRPDG